MLSPRQFDKNINDASSDLSDLDEYTPEFQEVRRFLLDSGLTEEVVGIFRQQGLDNMDCVLDLEDHHIKSLSLGIGEVLKINRGLNQRRLARGITQQPSTAERASEAGSSATRSTRDLRDLRQSIDEQPRESSNEPVFHRTSNNNSNDNNNNNNKVASSPSFLVQAVLLVVVALALGAFLWKERQWAKTESELRYQLSTLEEQRSKEQTGFQEQIAQLQAAIERSTDEFRQSREKESFRYSAGIESYRRDVEQDRENPEAAQLSTPRWRNGFSYLGSRLRVVACLATLAIYATAIRFHVTNGHQVSLQVEEVVLLVTPCPAIITWMAPTALGSWLWCFYEVVVMIGAPLFVAVILRENKDEVLKYARSFF
mmetsp:Transcript_22064/g.48226  ORF Transcript_22064/g.48226 Transcript_22064/m.48226 type:complete len:370 (-) Transcript_22064:547-1656(-)